MSAMVRKRPFKASVRMVAKCHEATFAAQQIAFLFDHRVGAQQEGFRNCEAHSLRGL